jgi:hypothetical protein
MLTHYGFVPCRYIDLWLDILTQDEATAFPAEDVSLPPSEVFEVRLVVWGARNVKPSDWLTGQNDLFVKVRGAAGGVEADHRDGLALSLDSVGIQKNWVRGGDGMTTSY